MSQSITEAELLSHTATSGAIYFTYGNEEWEMRGRFQERAICIPMAGLADVWQKSTQKPAILLYNILKELFSN